MITKTPTKDMTHEEWLNERRNSIGGSEIGAILGLNHFTSAYSIWANKTGKEPDKEPNEAMRQGTDLEAYVAERFTEKTGLKVERCNYIIRNSDYPHIHANIDRKIVGMNAGLECKTASALNEKAFKDGNFPESYYAQCVTYMAVTGKPTWYLAALILGRDFKVYRLTTIEDLPLEDWCESSVYVAPEEFEGIRQTALDFWDYVETDTAPPVDGRASTTETIKNLYPEEEAGTMADLFGMDEVFLDLNEYKLQEKELKENITRCENAIKERVGLCECGSVGKFTVSWKTQKRTSVDFKAIQKDYPMIDFNKYTKLSTSRVLRIREAK